MKESTKVKICKNMKMNTNEYEQEDRLEYIQRMTDEGKRIVYPKPNELFIDIDTNESFQHFLDILPILQRKYPRQITWSATLSKSGFPHQHIIVKLPMRLSSNQRLAYQAALGSDRAGVLVDIFRVESGGLFPIVFCEE